VSTAGTGIDHTSVGISIESRQTLMFSGHGDQVAGLYAGMDLRENFYSWRD
jgi:hypothetical protein